MTRTFRCRAPIVACLAVTLLLASCVDRTSAQRRDRDRERGRQRDGQTGSALRSLDRDGDGQLSPQELSPQNRTIILQLAAIANLDPGQPLPIDKLEAAVASLSRQGNGRNQRNGDQGNLLPPGVPGFGNGTGTTFLPGFGTSPEIVTLEDIQLARESLERFDRDDDGQLDEREMRRLRLRGDEMQFDKNNNDHIDETELATALAMQRALGREFNPVSDDDESDRDRDRDDNGDRRRRRDRGNDDERERERNRLREISRLRTGVMDRYDIDRDNFLSPLECKLAGHDISLTDTDGDDRVSEEELDAWIQESYPEPEDEEQLEYDLPEWFLIKDRNGDNQIAMAEFETNWTNERAAEFGKFDTDNDGIITQEEVILAQREGDYQNNSAIVIPADGRVTSEIEIADRFYLSDLDVHLSVTHSRDEDLDIFLISPDGVRVELACEVGGSDDHFDGTIIDAEAQIDIDNEREARPPFAGRFAPSRRYDDLSGLDDLYDRDEPSNAEGVWTLLIETDGSDRPGILHRWALTTRPRDYASCELGAAFGHACL